MAAMIDIQIPGMGKEKVIPESADQAIEKPTPLDAEIAFCPKPQPAHPTIAMMSNSRVSTLAVVDESGYLVSIFTAGDLLVGLKNIWRATQY